MLPNIPRTGAKASLLRCRRFRSPASRIPPSGAACCAQGMFGDFFAGRTLTKCAFEVGITHSRFPLAARIAIPSSLILPGF